MKAISGTGDVMAGTPFVKKVNCSSFFGDSDIAIDGVFVVDDSHLLPLGLDRGAVNLSCNGRNEHNRIKEGKKKGKPEEGSLESER